MLKYSHPFVLILKQSRTKFTYRDRCVCLLISRSIGSFPVECKQLDVYIGRLPVGKQRCLERQNTCNAAPMSLISDNPLPLTLFQFPTLVYIYSQSFSNSKDHEIDVHYTQCFYNCVLPRLNHKNFFGGFVGKQCAAQRTRSKRGHVVSDDSDIILLHVYNSSFSILCNFVGNFVIWSRILCISLLWFNE